MSRTILVVDDEALIRTQIRTVLEKNGYSTLEAADGIEALEIASWSKPDLIILNYCMPRLDGLDTLKAIRERNQIIPIIMESMIIEKLKEKCPTSLNVSAFIQLPLRPEQLLQSVRQALANSCNRNDLV